MSGKPKVDVKKWLEKVQRAEEYWLNIISRTDEIVKMFRAQPSSHVPTDLQDWPEVNKVWEYIQSVLPQIFYRAPHAFVNPLKPGNQRKAEVVEAVLNGEIRKIKLTKHGRKVCLDALLRGWGVAKIGYVPPALAYAITPTSPKDEEALVSGTPGPENVEDLNGQVKFFHVPIKDFIWDPESEDLENASWCCHITFEDLDDIKANKRYSNTEDLQATSYYDYHNYLRQRSEDSDLRHLREEDRKFVKLYEIWIRDGEQGRRLLVIADSNAHSQKWLRWEEWPFTRMNDYPFSLLSFCPDPDSSQPGLSDVAPWVNLQSQMNGMLVRMVEFVNRMKAKTLYDSSLPADVVKMLEVADDRSLIPVDVSKLSLDNKKISDFVYPIPNPQLPAEMWGLWRQLETLLHQVSGHTPYGMQQAQASQTATESAILEKTSSLRIEDKLANGVAEWMVDCFKKMLSVIQEFFDSGEVAVLTPAGVQEFKRFQSEDLDVDAAVTIDFGTMGRIISDEQRGRNLVMLAQQLAPFLADPRGVPAALRELIRRVLEAYHVVDSDALLPYQAPPVNPQDENTRMLLGQAVEPTPLDDHQFHLMVHKPCLVMAVEKGMQGNAELIQAHMLMHNQMLEMAAREGQGGGGQMPSLTANPSADQAPVATPTGPEQGMGLQIAGGL